jgi:hypothetical protein
MQTWIHTLGSTRPVDQHTDWGICAESTDLRRGRKQAVEAQQIVMALCGDTTAYAHHAVTLSWAGHVPALAWYGLVFARHFGVQRSADYLVRFADRDASIPPWFGLPNILGPVVSNQRSRLVTKEMEVVPATSHYSRLYPDAETTHANLYATQLLCPYQPGDQVLFDLRGRREPGRVVAVRPAGLEVRIQHDRGGCWRRTTTIARHATLV